MKKVFISTAMFMTAFVAADASTPAELHAIDCQIRQLRREIADLRRTNKRRISDSLRRNYTYSYVMEHQPRIDSLRIECARLLDEAYDIVRRQNRLSIPVRTPYLFRQYSAIYQIRSKGNLYDMYQREIKDFEKKKASIDGFEVGVKNHFDSIMHAEIERRQIMMDSLLNKKFEMIR